MSIGDMVFTENSSATVAGSSSDAGPNATTPLAMTTASIPPRRLSASATTDADPERTIGDDPLPHVERVEAFGVATAERETARRIGKSSRDAGPEPSRRADHQDT